ncbi:MAG TPA: hypothetical protein VJI75_03950 [Candidatus Nanoarchaeia archaeon]|nr:hypothetical protein [Candidatus Nanoarchaeia archaeon]
MANTTNEIIPRNYGITLHSPYNKRLFLCPSQYMLGHLTLETSAEIRARLHEYSERKGIPYRKLSSDFRAKVMRREKGTGIIDLSRRLALKEVNRYGGKISAQVLSKSGVDHYPVNISDAQRFPSGRLPPGIEYHDSKCSCESAFWADVKEIDISCPHISALEIALVSDNNSPKDSAKRNITGLTKKARGDFNELPFALSRIGAFSNGRIAIPEQRALTDLMMGYYLENKNQYDIDVEALSDEMMYTPALRAEMLNGSAVFSVLRQKESAASDLSSSEARYQGAVRALVERISSELQTRDYRSKGYAREFVGTDFESVARRWENGVKAYHICTSRENPPLIVVRHLEKKAHDWMRPDDPRQDSPFRRIGESYTSIDDASRREGSTQVVIPGERPDSMLFVPEELKRRYAALKRGE